jgi:hypothetical protein
MPKAQVEGDKKHGDKFESLIDRAGSREPGERDENDDDAPTPTHEDDDEDDGDGDGDVEDSTDDDA